ncbi:hypothetical protein K440DRAFT_194857 [Wilcoxina mikolae CBS 423.85]|nr:hypothetical protein K440DRAFT_194857 [Wilcoxina mikolae CBS 423.85]
MGAGSRKTKFGGRTGERSRGCKSFEPGDSTQATSQRRRPKISRDSKRGSTGDSPSFSAPGMAEEASRARRVANCSSRDFTQRARSFWRTVAESGRFSAAMTRSKTVSRGERIRGGGEGRERTLTSKERCWGVEVWLPLVRVGRAGTW